MRIVRRAPREVYRVYGEREYLAGADWEPSTRPLVGATAAGLRGRVVSVTMLLGAVGVVGGVVAANTVFQSSAPWHGIDKRVRSHSYTAVFSASAATVTRVGTPTPRYTQTNVRRGRTSMRVRVVSRRPSRHMATAVLVADDVQQQSTSPAVLQQVAASADSAAASVHISQEQEFSFER